MHSSDRDHELDELLRAVFLFLMQKAGRKADPEQILKSARRVAEELLGRCASPVAWEAAHHATVQQVRRPAMLYRPVRIVAHLVHMSEPRLAQVSDMDGKTTETVAAFLRLRDTEGTEIGTLPVLGEALVDKLLTMRQRAHVEVLARTLAVFDMMTCPHLAFVLQVFDARPSVSVLDLLGASDQERDEAAALLAGLAPAGTSPLEHILNEIVRGLRVVALDEFPLLRNLLRFTVLQALSCGRLDHASGRLHALVAGPPASGKKLLGLASRALNPRWAEASAAKISAAGLVGASHPAAGGWKSQPGLIAGADQGVVVLQDAHAISPAELRRLGPVLQEVIEDGVVRDSVAGGVQRETAAALLIDLNRLSQLVTSRKGSPTEAALLLLRPLLSRLDLIVDIPADVKRAWTVAGAIYGTIGPGGRTFDEQPWVRRLRLLVGALRDRHPEVNLDPVRDGMRAVHEEIAAENEKLFSTAPELGDIPVRLAITMARFVSASARAHDRSVAEVQDIEEALTFVRLKLQFLRVAVPDLARAVESAERVDADDRTEEHGAGQVVHVADFAKRHAEATGDDICERTARRHLRRLGAVRRGPGLYLLPSSEK